MSRQERYGTRDQTYSRWHRALADGRHGRQLSYIDLDGIEYCDRCGSLLALIEAAWDVGQRHKATTVLAKLAVKAGIPAYCVMYEKAQDGQSIVMFRVRRVYPDPTRLYSLTPAQWEARIRAFRSCHPWEQAA